MEKVEDGRRKKINQLTSVGTLKSTANWILEACEEISPEAMKKFFKSCALNLPTDVSEDNLVHCLKEDKFCKSEKEILRS